MVGKYDRPENDEMGIYRLVDEFFSIKSCKLKNGAKKIFYVAFFTELF